MTVPEFSWIKIFNYLIILNEDRLKMLENEAGSVWLRLGVENFLEDRNNTGLPFLFLKREKLNKIWNEKYCQEFVILSFLSIPWTVTHFILFLVFSDDTMHNVNLGWGLCSWMSYSYESVSETEIFNLWKLVCLWTLCKTGQQTKFSVQLWTTFTILHTCESSYNFR